LETLIISFEADDVFEDFAGLDGLISGCCCAVKAGEGISIFDKLGEKMDRKTG